jgi:hypothetical protein
MAVVADYYDQRDNDKKYRSFASMAGYFGWIFFGGYQWLGFLCQSS